MIGTTGSAPISGTSTSGISAPVPYPASPPITDANSATAATSKSCSSEMSAKPESRFTAGDRGRNRAAVWSAIAASADGSSGKSAASQASSASVST